MQTVRNTLRNTKYFVHLIVITACLSFYGFADHPPANIRSVIGTELILVQKGSFYRGSKENGGDQEPRRKIEVDSFYMSKYPVTQREYERVMGENPSRRHDPDSPVESVRWSDAVRFCNALSRLDGLRPVYCTEEWSADFEAEGYRLPTEAEWEYAARAGTESRFFWGDDAGRLGRFAWFKQNAAGRIRPVGRKLPNPWGFFDIYGNVWEWCHDYYNDDYYKESDLSNPTGPEEGEEKVLRGGSWDTSAAQISSSFRYSEAPGYYDVCFGYDMYGFRIVRNAGDK